MTVRSILIPAAAIMLMVPAFSKDGQEGFQGKWSMDTKASSQGAPGHLQENIKVNGNDIVIESKYDQPQNGLYELPWLGVMTEKFNLTGDGQQVMNQIGPYQHVSKTTIDGNTMTTEWNAADPPGTVEGKWVRTLSDDGRHMTLKITGKASDGRNIDETIVFNRK